MWFTGKNRIKLVSLKKYSYSAKLWPKNGVQAHICHTLLMLSAHFFGPLLTGKWAWSPRAPLMVWGLQTQPKSWSTRWTFWVKIDSYILSLTTTLTSGICIMWILHVLPRCSSWVIFSFLVVCALAPAACQRTDSFYIKSKYLVQSYLEFTHLDLTRF